MLFRAVYKFWHSNGNSGSWYTESAFVVAPSMQEAVQKTYDYAKANYHRDDKEMKKDFQLLSVRVVNAILIK